MKQILQSPVKQETLATQNSKNSGNRIEQVNKIFLKFSIFYGHIWRSQYKNEFYSNFARDEWSQALHEFDEKIIDEAINKCLENREMPPTLSQFIELCKQLKRNNYFYKEEPYQGCNPDIAKAELKKIKNTLKMKN
ncbi:MAG: Vir protein [Tatlockia sp.]|nr:Vir protein [Tatlockia sp.]